MMSQREFDVARYLFAHASGLRESMLPAIREECLVFEKSGMYDYFVEEVFLGRVRQHLLSHCNLSAEDAQTILNDEFLSMILGAEEEANGNS